MKGPQQISNCYDHYFQVYALEFFYQTLPWQWFKAQAIAESGLDPTAVSPVKAKGVMQLMPFTAAEIATKLGIDNVGDVIKVPHVNIRLGIAYDRQCWDMWKREQGIERIRFMLGSYNAGPGNILRAQQLAERAKLPTDRWEFITMSLPEITGRHATETINYVQKVETVFASLATEKKQ